MDKSFNLRHLRISKFPAVSAVILTFFCTAVNSVFSEELEFLTWADYIDPELVAEFEQETGIRIKFSYYESDDARDEILSSNDGRGYDLAIANGLILQSYAKRDWLAPIEQDSIPNLAHIEPQWRDAFPAAQRYAVPYFWGTLGIAYRQDLVPEGFTSWKDFFEPAESLRGKITMLKSSRDILGMALKSLGYSANSSDRDAIREAGRVLEAQRPYVRSYEYISLSEKSALVSGEVWASLAYSGDTLMVQEHHDDIAYVVPEEGGNLWVDYLTVFQSSPRKDLAFKFVDFLNRPEIAARNAEFVYYATPNIAARQYVSDEYAKNPVIHPLPSVIERSETYQKLAPRAQRTVNSVFAELVN
jgi:spermidine/putrescine transport system substrate-binding protein